MNFYRYCTRRFYHRLFDLGCFIRDRSTFLFTVYRFLLGAFILTPKNWELISSVGKYSDKYTGECYSPLNGVIISIRCRTRIAAQTVGRIIARGHAIWSADI